MKKFIHAFFHCYSASRFTFVTAVFTALLLSTAAYFATAAATDAVKAGPWHLQAYHLHHHTDVAAGADTTAAPTLLDERNLISDTCALDTVVTALSAKKSLAGSGCTTQSVGIRRRDLTLTPTLTNPTTLRRSPALENEIGMPESVASVSVRKRDAGPTQLHTVGVVDLGVFQAESVDVAKAAVLPLTDLEGEEDAAALPVLIDPGDETEHLFEVSFFLGDFTRTLCIGAAVYANKNDVGNFSAALVAWVPHSVSPACAMRLSPYLHGLAGLSLTEEDLLQGWPHSEQQQCHLSEGHKFSFTFMPSLAHAKNPSFCKYERKASGATVAPTPGTRRQVKCEVYLDLQLTTWYSSALAEVKANTTVLKVAAAVTETAATPTHANTPPAVKAVLPSIQRQQQNVQPLNVFEFASKGADEEVIQSIIQPPVTPVHPAAHPRHPQPLASAASRVGGISRYKGTLWCTDATVGSGFWFSDAGECVKAIEARVNGDTVIHRSKLFWLRDGLFLFVVGITVAGFTGVLTARVVKTVRQTHRRRMVSR